MNGHKYPRQWEPINQNTNRLRVPDGWLVWTTTRMITADKIHVNSEALVFVQDEDKHWELEPS